MLDAPAWARQKLSYHLVNVRVMAQALVQAGAVGKHGVSFEWP